MNPRHVTQWLLVYVGAILHAFSISTLKTDEDTAPDCRYNLQLDRADFDGNSSDGMEEGWHRLRTERWRRWPHNLKNLWREWIEIVHPKTVARVSGLMIAIPWVLAVIGWVI